MTEPSCDVVQTPDGRWQIVGELEARLLARAARLGITPEECLRQVVDAGLHAYGLDAEADDAELARDIAISDAEFERGEGIPHEQVVQEMEAIIGRARR